MNLSSLRIQLLNGLAGASSLFLVAATIAAYAQKTYAEPPIVRTPNLVEMIYHRRLVGRETLSINTL